MTAAEQYKVISRDSLAGDPTIPVGELRYAIDVLARIPTPAQLRENPDAPEVFAELLRHLNAGTVRAAEPVDGEDGKVEWQVNPWVREGIVRVGFRLGHVEPVSATGDVLYFSDKVTLPTKSFADAPDRNVRIVPGGSSVRAGSYIGPDVIMMPPSYVNIGAYVGEGTMIDSLALVGSCAQVGSRVHLAAGAIVGGVLEPANARPCIVEDGVQMLAGSKIFEGVVLRKGAVLAPNTTLASGIEVWERTEDGKFKQLKRDKEDSIEIPERALVVPRTRTVTVRDSEGAEWSTSFSRPVAMIVGYVPEGGNPKLALNEALRTR